MKREDFRKLEDGWYGNGHGKAPQPDVIDKMEEIADLLAHLGDWEFVPIESGDEGQLEISEQGWQIEIWVSAYR